MVDPPDWPERPSFAQDFDEFWLCYGHLPPEPWPDLPPGPVDHAVYGPEGTEWTYSATQYINRLTVLGAGQGAQAAVNVALRRLKGLTLPPFYTLGWRVPAEIVTPPVEVRMRWFHVTVHGKLGTNEEVAHTFNLRTQPAPDVDQSVANVQTLANQIRDKWAAMMGTLLPGGAVAFSSRLSTNLVYDEVRVAYLEQLVAGVNPKGVKDPAKRPAYIVPTQYAAFTPGAVKGTAAATSDLPWETALCLTLNSNVRGRSARGRSYLGGLSNAVMGSNGLFNATEVNHMGQVFGEQFIAAVNASTGAQFQVVSRTHLQAAPIQGVRVGVVPDSQRRRRRNQPEAYTQQWGVPIGGAA